MQPGLTETPAIEPIRGGAHKITTRTVCRGGRSPLRVRPRRGAGPRVDGAPRGQRRREVVLPASFAAGRPACRLHAANARHYVGGPVDVHHVMPLHKIGDSLTGMSDLALVLRLAIGFFTSSGRSSLRPSCPTPPAGTLQPRQGSTLPSDPLRAGRRCAKPLVPPPRPYHCTAGGPLRRFLHSTPTASPHEFSAS